ncbi:hypothetical protein CDO24_25240 (plasmid) [Sinorhizobium meliloti]|nr:hypothetical protein CDO24_25240 [Sinorhizobium meliloti]
MVMPTFSACALPAKRAGLRRTIDVSWVNLPQLDFRVRQTNGIQVLRKIKNEMYISFVISVEAIGAMAPLHGGE